MQELLLTTISGIIIALLASGGFWTYLEHKQERNEANSKKKRMDQINSVATEVQAISKKLDDAADKIETIEGQVTELYSSQSAVEAKLDRIKDIEDKFGNLESLIQDLQEGSTLSIATARDRLNYLTNKYMSLGYIPQEDYVAFKTLGDAYVNYKHNTEVKTKFIYCIDNLKVVDTLKSNNIDR